MVFKTVKLDFARTVLGFININDNLNFKKNIIDMDNIWKNKLTYLMKGLQIKNEEIEALFLHASIDDYKSLGEQFERVYYGSIEEANADNEKRIIEDIKENL